MTVVKFSNDSYDYSNSINIVVDCLNGTLRLTHIDYRLNGGQGCHRAKSFPRLMYLKKIRKYLPIKITALTIERKDHILTSSMTMTPITALKKTKRNVQTIGLAHHDFLRALVKYLQRHTVSGQRNRSHLSGRSSTTYQKIN